MVRIRILPGQTITLGNVVYTGGAEVEAEADEAAYHVSAGAAEIVIPSPRAAVAAGPERARHAVKRGPSRATPIDLPSDGRADHARGS